MRKKAITTLTAAATGLRYLFHTLEDLRQSFRAWRSSYSLAADIAGKIERDRDILILTALTGEQPEVVKARIDQLIQESRGIWSYQQAADIVERYAMETGQLPAGLDFGDRDFYNAAVASGHVKAVRPEDVKVVVSAVWIKQGYGYHFSAN